MCLMFGVVPNVACTGQRQSWGTIIPLSQAQRSKKKKRQYLLHLGVVDFVKECHENIGENYLHMVTITEQADLTEGIIMETLIAL